MAACSGQAGLGAVCVNIAAEPAEPVAAWIRADQADACDLPERISSERYDLVFSNSVIEHVGGHAQRMRFAEAIHKISNRHWVQTPYRYFPVEPHWLFPGLQFMPLALRARLLRHSASGAHQGREASMTHCSVNGGQAHQPHRDAFLFPGLRRPRGAWTGTCKVLDRHREIVSGGTWAASYEHASCSLGGRPSRGTQVLARRLGVGEAYLGSPRLPQSRSTLTIDRALRPVRWQPGCMWEPCGRLVGAEFACGSAMISDTGGCSTRREYCPRYIAACRKNGGRALLFRECGQDQWSIAHRSAA